MSYNVALVVDCRMSNTHEAKYYALNLWGKSCFEYVCDTVMQFIQYKKYLITDSPKIKSMCQSMEGISIVCTLDEIKEKVVALISGTAVLLKPDTISELINSYGGG